MMKGKAKRLLSLLLTAALLCGFLPAAFAADTVPPLYEQMGYSSSAEFMENEGFYKVDYDWVCERYQVNLKWVKQYPEVILEEYPWYDSVDEYFAAWGEETGWRNIALLMVSYDQGSFSPPLSVQLNGQTLAFADAQPEMAGTRVMVPLRGMIDALGGETAFDLAAKTVSATANGVTVHMTIGETAYSSSLTPAEQQEQQAGLAENQNAGGAHAGVMDVAPYLKDGRTYVPVRFFAEALGLTVRWDEDARTAVVYDAAVLVAEIDKNFTIVNQWLAAQPKRKTDETLRTAVALALSYTKFHTIDGNTTYPVSGTMTVVTEGQSGEFEVKIDLRTLLDLLVADLGDWLDEDDSKLYDAIKGDLKNARFEMIFNADEHIVYFRCPVLIRFFQQTDAEYVKGIDPEDWLKASVPESESLLNGLPGMEKLDALRDGVTVGTLLAAAADSGFTYNSAALWQNALDTAAELALWVGDDRFTASGNSHTAAFAYDSEQDDAPYFVPYNGYAKGSLTLNTSTGAVKASFEMRENGYRDQLTTCVIEGNAAAAHVSLTVHTANVGIFELTADVSQKAGGPAPRTAPPEGSTVIDLDALTAAPAA